MLSTAQNSRFEQYRLKYGISLQLPKHWQIIEKRVMDQIDTNTEILTGTPQGNNEILIAANYYSRDPKNAAATARLSVRHKQTIDQSQLLGMTDNDIRLEALMGKSSLENALRNVDPSILVTEYRVIRKTMRSFVCLETVYTLSNDKREILYIVPLGSWNIKLHLSYKLSEEQYINPTIMHIINSLSIE